MAGVVALWAEDNRQVMDLVTTENKQLTYVRLHSFLPQTRSYQVRVKGCSNAT